MSLPPPRTTPGVSDSEGPSRSPFNSKGSHEGSASSTPPTSCEGIPPSSGQGSPASSSQGSPVKAPSLFASDEERAIMIQITDEGKANRLVLDTYASISGDKQRQKQIRAERAQRKYIKVKDRDGREYQYQAKHLEEAREKFKTLPEIEAEIARLFALLKPRIAWETKTRERMKKFFDMTSC